MNKDSEYQEFLTEIRSVLKERKKLWEDTMDEWYEELDRCWEKECKILVKDFAKTLYFFANDATDRELAWISEVFEEIAQATQSHEFVHVIEERLKLVTDKKIIHSLKVEIMYAKGWINDWEED